MLDYDKACGRDTPSVACIVDPFTATSRQAAFWGTTPHYLPSELKNKNKTKVNLQRSKLNLRSITPNLFLHGFSGHILFT